MHPTGKLHLILKETEISPLGIIVIREISLRTKGGDQETIGLLLETREGSGRILHHFSPCEFLSILILPENLVQINDKFF